jgi:hypothetical protein
VGQKAKSLHIITQSVLMLQNPEVYMFTLEILSEVMYINMIRLVGKERILLNAVFMKTQTHK